MANVLVVGEICNLNKHYTGHYYFSIKDENSKISCMMFSFNASRINFDAKNGDEVLIKGYVFKNKYNPGTTADLTAASIFVSYLKSHFE